MVSFSRLVEQATSESLLEVNWALNLQITDLVRSGEVSGKEAIRQIKKRMFNRNANVVLYTLTLLEALVKNCGGPVQSEVATRDFMDQFRRLVRGSIATVKPRCLELIQTWAHAFEGQPRYKVVPDTYNVLRMEGHEFPPHNPHGDAMFVAEVAPEWADSRECYACRCKFTLTNRKHHCRKCGQVFCGKCSAKEAAIPKFGIEKAVRVCDFCYGQLQGSIPEGSTAPQSSAGLGTSLSPGSGGAMGTAELSPEEEVRRFVEQERQMQARNGGGGGGGGSSTGGRSEKELRDLELKEQEEMELALALSMSENDKGPATSRGYSSDYSAYNQASAPDPSPQPTPSRTFSNLYSAQIEEADAMSASDDPMNAYLGLSGGPSPGPAVCADESSVVDTVTPLASREDVKFLSALRSGLELFEQKLARAKQRGIGVHSDRTLQQMYRSLSLMHPELITRIDNLEDDKGAFLTLQEKLDKIRTTWAQLEAAKREQIRRAEEQRREQETLQRLQLEQKMKLIARQEEEKRQYMREMEERIRLQELEQRRIDEERALAQQQADMEKQQQQLLAQQEALRLRRQETEAAQNRYRQPMPPQMTAPGPGVGQQTDAMRIHQMHMAAEADRSQRMGMNPSGQFGNSPSGRYTGPAGPPPGSYGAPGMPDQVLKPPQPNAVPQPHDYGRLQQYAPPSTSHQHHPPPPHSQAHMSGQSGQQNGPPPSGGPMGGGKMGGPPPNGSFSGMPPQTQAHYQPPQSNQFQPPPQAQQHPAASPQRGPLISFE
eukprot:m.435420 g.435420  ORF g.435420 m.435420 type:complete len:772 (-) comp17847_c0_seq1:52-2367(-)